MLISLTIAHNPIERAVDSLTSKYQKEATNKARLEICDHIVQMRDVYSSNMRDIFKIGCLFDVKLRLLQACHGDPKKVQEIEKIFNDRDSEFWEERLAEC